MAVLTTIKSDASKLDGIIAELSAIDPRMATAVTTLRQNRGVHHAVIVDHDETDGLSGTVNLSPGFNLTTTVVAAIFLLRQAQRLVSGCVTDADVDAVHTTIHECEEELSNLVGVWVSAYTDDQSTPHS